MDIIPIRLSESNLNVCRANDSVRARWDRCYCNYAAAVARSGDRDRIFLSLCEKKNNNNERKARPRNNILHRRILNCRYTNRNVFFCNLAANLNEIKLYAFYFIDFIN